MSLPIVGTWMHWALFGGDFPGNVVLPRLYVLHVLLVPAIMFALVAVHLALVWYQNTLSSWARAAPSPMSLARG